MLASLVLVCVQARDEVHASSHDNPSWMLDVGAFAILTFAVGQEATWEATWPTHKAQSEEELLPGWAPQKE